MRACDLQQQVLPAGDRNVVSTELIQKNETAKKH